MDMQWLAGEAKQLHSLFASFFNSIVLTMIIGGVVINYFKMPLGQVPEFLTLIGRAIVASFILAAFPEILNFMADLTDNLASTIGNLHNFKLVLTRLGDKIGQFTWSWVSVKDSILLIISYLTFFSSVCVGLRRRRSLFTSVDITLYLCADLDCCVYAPIDGKCH